METRRIEVKKPLIEDTATSQFNIVCGYKHGNPAITETELEFAKN